MRICIYTETALPKVGGHEVAVDSLAREFMNQGQSVTVLAPLPRKLKTKDADLPYPIVRHPRFISTRRLVSWYRYFLLRHAKHSPFDVLHCQGIYPPGYLAALCKDRLNVPIVITSQGGDVNPTNVRLAKPVVKARQIKALAAADALVSISEFTRTGFLRLCPTVQRIVDIPNGVDLRPFREQAPVPANLDPAIRPGEYALFLGRLKHRKGVDVLLEGLAQHPADFMVAIAGDGDDRPALEAQAQRLNLTHRVKFLGNQFGAAKVYLLQNARLVVMPTRSWEGLPLVACEAFGAGAPVLGTTVPGVTDIVTAGKTGWLVAPESADELGRTINSAMSNRAQCEEYGRHARVAAENYAWPVIVRQHLDLYESLLSKRAAA